MSKRKYKAAYERKSIQTFNDICLGEEREFDLVVYASMKVGEHEIAVVKDPDAFFYYTAVDGYLIDCHYGYEKMLPSYRYLIQKYKRANGYKKKPRNDARRKTNRYYY